MQFISMVVRVRLPLSLINVRRCCCVEFDKIPRPPPPEDDEIGHSLLGRRLRLLLADRRGRLLPCNVQLSTAIVSALLSGNTS